MTDIVGVTNVAQAFSLLAAFQSISMFTGGPLAGMGLIKSFEINFET